MTTDELINTLSGNVAPVPRGAVERRVLLGVLVGLSASLALMVGWLGFRADMPQALMGTSFWMKWLYTISLAVLALAVTAHVARPDAPRLGRLWLLALPVAVLAAIALGELLTAPVALWQPMWLGVSARQCSLRVAALSLPVFGGLLWSFRSLAPSNLRAAGAAAGLCAGAFAATIYGLHCPEVKAVFVVTWYTLGMAAASAFGALVGPRLMRW